VLELGCGTGRVLLPLADHCGYIHGVDISEGMIAICKRKLADEAYAGDRAMVEVADICELNLKSKFDLIIAPFRVFQSLETDQQASAALHTIKTHLAPGGTCILNVFRPWVDETALRRDWESMSEDRERWGRQVGAGRVVCHERIVRVHKTRLICYPRVSYRYYEENGLKDSAELDIAMRCYYPDEFERLIVSHGFRVLDKWGGYEGEKYGEGPELIVQFANEGTPAA
jgi:SAM-dependent methyltransferase